MASLQILRFKPLWQQQFGFTIAMFPLATFYYERSNVPVSSGPGEEGGLEQLFWFCFLLQ